MDPDNPVIKLCAEGMGCEAKGEFAAAARVFLTAWERSTDDFERCISAHYVARHQEDLGEALVWNRRSLDYALEVKGERVSRFLPSLYLNVGKAYEDLNRWEEARSFYAMATQALSGLPDDAYGRTVRGAIERGLERVEG